MRRTGLLLLVLLAVGATTLSAQDPPEPTRVYAAYYQVSFSAQISSTSASDVKFYFWPRLNGVDVPGATMINTLHNNGASVVTSRTAAFDISAGDYLEAMWAVDSTDGFLEAASATAFAPAAPASTISIVRLHG